jgi:hypothetical protein
MIARRRRVAVANTLRGWPGAGEFVLARLVICLMHAQAWLGKIQRDRLIPSSVDHGHAGTDHVPIFDRKPVFENPD